MSYAIKVRRMDIMTNEQRLAMYRKVYEMQEDGRLSSTNVKKLIKSYLTSEIGEVVVPDV